MILFYLNVILRISVFLMSQNYVTRQLVPWLQRRCPHCLIRCGWKIALIALFHMYSLMLFNKFLLSFLFKKKSIALILFCNMLLSLDCSQILKEMYFVFQSKKVICEHYNPYLTKLEFVSLEISGKNYLSLILDVEILLMAMMGEPQQLPLGRG